MLDLITEERWYSKTRRGERVREKVLVAASHLAVYRTPQWVVVRKEDADPAEISALVVPPSAPGGEFRFVMPQLAILAREGVRLEDVQGQERIALEGLAKFELAPTSFEPRLYIVDLLDGAVGIFELLEKIEADPVLRSSIERVEPVFAERITGRKTV